MTRRRSISVSLVDAAFGTIAPPVIEAVVRLPARKRSKYFETLAHSYPLFMSAHHSFSSKGPYITRSWLDTPHTRGNISESGYLDALANWERALPKSVKQAIPDDLLRDHIRSCNIPFLNVGFP